MNEKNEQMHACVEWVNTPGFSVDCVNACVCVGGWFSGPRDKAHCGQVVSAKRLVWKVGSRLLVSTWPRDGQGM